MIGIRRTGKILVTLSPLPTQNALNPPPSPYIRSTAVQRFEKALDATPRGWARWLEALGLKCETFSVVMRYILSRSNGAVTVLDTENRIHTELGNSYKGEAG